MTAKKHSTMDGEVAANPETTLPIGGKWAFVSHQARSAPTFTFGLTWFSVGHPTVTSKDVTQGVP
ncbi:hypothetical protein FVEN_g12859 [Fusarium venenatum]|nr:hypothetical protein FVEN_g12859 [Fusarium venenatum]